jgi:hypothetical protein
MLRKCFIAVVLFSAVLSLSLMACPGSIAAAAALDPDDDLADTSIFENKAGLSDDMGFLASMPGSY